MEREQIIKDIQTGSTALGIEFGSTRIKAVLVGSDNTPIASGAHDWENQYEDHIWTYSLDAIWKGLQDCYQNMAKDVKNQYGVVLETVGAVGFSAMMHGYMAFSQSGELLVPFRTWRNTITEEADAAVSVQYSPEMEHCPPVPGHLKQRRTCKLHCLFHYPCRLCPLEADRASGAGRRRGFRHVPH